MCRGCKSLAPSLTTSYLNEKPPVRTKTPAANTKKAYGLETDALHVGGAKYALNKRTKARASPGLDLIARWRIVCLLACPARRREVSNQASANSSETNNKSSAGMRIRLSSTAFVLPTPSPVARRKPINAMAPVDIAEAENSKGRSHVFHSDTYLTDFRNTPVYATVPIDSPSATASSVLVTASPVVKPGRGARPSRGRMSGRSARPNVVKPITIKDVNMAKPRAAHDDCGLRDALMNFVFFPRSRIRNGAPNATTRGPQRSIALEGSSGLASHSVSTPTAKAPAPKPAKYK